MTKYKIALSDIAEEDIRQAKEWYNLQQKRLGKKLAADIKITASSIKRTHSLHPSVIKMFALHIAECFPTVFITKFMKAKI